MMLRKREDVTMIIVHCSDTEQGDVKSIRRFHVETRKWADIGYHFVIRRDGEIEVGRPIEHVGAHCEGANRNSIGVCLIGKTQFEQAQFEALKKLIRSLRWLLGERLSVRGHREFPSAKRQGKTCPNFEVRDLGV
jgi:N-acetyl-anhydromuramyl-L-alanine amidase AmpD